MVRVQSASKAVVWCYKNNKGALAQNVAENNSKGRNFPIFGINKGGPTSLLKALESSSCSSSVFQKITVSDKKDRERRAVGQGTQCRQIGQNKAKLKKVGKFIEGIGSTASCNPVRPRELPFSYFHIHIHRNLLRGLGR